MKRAALIFGKMRAACRLVFVLSVLPPALPCFSSVFLSPAAAQSWRHESSRPAPSPAAQPPKRRSLWDRLFGLNKRQDYDRPRQNRAPPPPRKTAPAKAPAKNPDARRILVLGDFTAAALAEALSRAYSDNPDIIIRSKTENASGLARSAPYDWTAAVKALAAQEKPSLIIVMLGANDRPAQDASPPARQSAYQARLAAFARALQKSGAAWLWVGLPPFKDSALNDNAAALNGLYARAAEQAGGHFVSTAEGFVDDKGNFAFSGYDISGQPARLRANDGINFTLAGRRKLAFYATQAIDLLWGDAAEQALPDSGKTAKLQNARLAPVNPLDIGVSAKPVLAGSSFAPGGQAAAAAAQSSAETAKSAENANIEGRADDFRRPPAPAAP